jgi:hypothetical protein
VPASDGRDYVGVTRIGGVQIRWATQTQINPLIEKKYYEFRHARVRLRGAQGGEWGAG